MLDLGPVLSPTLGPCHRLPAPRREEIKGDAHTAQPGFSQQAAHTGQRHH